MRIDPKKCVACGNCVPICPMGAISTSPTIGCVLWSMPDECVECYACYRGMSKRASQSSDGEELSERLLRFSVSASIQSRTYVLRTRLSPRN